MLGRFIRDETGNFAVLSAILVLPVILATGAAVDLSRLNAARTHLQDLADTAALAMASSRFNSTEELYHVGDDSVRSNHARSAVATVSIADVRADADEVTIRLAADLKTSFMGLAGFPTFSLEAHAAAKRDTGGAVEVALVLDNTYSMIGPGKTGEKMKALKLAASNLVSVLMEDERLNVRISLVPYADYVHVGLEYKDVSWLVQEKQKAPTCWTQTSTSQCTQWQQPYACKKEIDGNVIDTTCGAKCLKEETVQHEPKQFCSNPDTRTWWGCVGSRTGGTPPNRLHDKYPQEPYLAIIDGHQNCPAKIVPLTHDHNLLLKALAGMTVEGPYYKPRTYIPSGLIWGQNVLSPTEPFVQAAAYDSERRNPRKIMILMTDGDNTMLAHSWGRHGELHKNDTPENEMSAYDRNLQDKQRKQTNDDSRAICNYMKKNGIEIYTVAFMVDTLEGQELMRDCASTPERYYDASDSENLLRAFEGIAGEISRVRLSS